MKRLAARLLSWRLATSPWMAQIGEIEPDVRAYLRRLFPDGSDGTPMKLRTPAGYYSHHVAIVESLGERRCRVFLKAPRTAEQWERMAAEARFLTDVAPRLAGAFPSARCPEVLAYHPHRRFLLLEVVEGAPLRSVLFGLGGVEHPHTLPGLLELCGSWLARLHTVTRSGDDGNPFEWLVGALEHPRISRTVGDYASPTVYRDLLDLARRFGRHYEALRTPRCTIHGAFSPRHVLVGDHQAYVIDLEQTRVGYAYEDLATFLRAYDMLLPWKRVLAAWRLDPEEQKRVFLDAYRAEAGSWTDPDLVVMRLARVYSMAEVLGGSGAQSWRRVRAGTLSVVRRTWWRHRFRAVCREELSALRDTARRVGLG